MLMPGAPGEEGKLSESPVVIGIPTFRRHGQLRELIDSLLPQLDERVAVMLVADNDCDSRTQAVVREAVGGRIAHQVLDVRERGISQARNALVHAAYEWAPGWRWLIMLDDDGQVLPGWFDALVGTAERLDADVAGGPVLGDLPPGSSRIARNSIYGGRLRFATGTVSVLNGAQNIAISRRLLDRLKAPWFRPDLGLVGGEDYEFFRRVRAAEGRLVWCDDACVNEPTAADRLTTKAIIRRAFRSNVVNGGIDALYGDHPTIGSYLLPVGRHLAREAAAGVVRRDLDRLTRTGLEAVSMAGRATGLTRSKYGRAFRHAPRD